MEQSSLPSPFARAAMSVLPAPVLQRMIDSLMRRMRTVHPRLFKNLGRLDASTVRIEPSDVPHCFMLTFGDGKVSLALTDFKDTACDACIKGKLEALLDMLEGRIDGDKLFFSRDIEITGNTAVVVALRNTLDREVIDLLADITSLFGPFARPAHEMILIADTVARHMRQRFSAPERKKAAAS
jgi:O2-independent ubiquinone biosynthesis accessory factor UbiT